MTYDPNELHRSGCATNWTAPQDCDCDGPTALADLRERLAAAVEALTPPPAHATAVQAWSYREGYTDARATAARVVRSRP